MSIITNKPKEAEHFLTVFDYAFLSQVLVISFGVGVYHQITYQRKFNLEFAKHIMCTADVSQFAILNCFVITYFSGSNYLYGCSLFFKYGFYEYVKPISIVLQTLFMVSFIIPVLKTYSNFYLNEYIKLRFSHRLQRLMGVVFVLSAFLHCGASLYILSDFVNQVIGVWFYIPIVLIPIMSYFQVSMGCIEAVSLGCCLQGILMVCGMFCLLAECIQKSQLNIIDAVNKSMYIGLDSQNSQPSYTIGSLAYSLFDGCFLMIGIYGVNPASIQLINFSREPHRYKYVYWAGTIIVLLLSVVQMAIGVMIYPRFMDLENVTIMNHYVRQEFGKFSLGSTGFYTATIIGSTISYIGLFYICITYTLSENIFHGFAKYLTVQETLMSKLLVNLFNVIIICIAVVIYFYTSLKNFAFDTLKSISIPAFSIYVMGMFNPYINEVGAIVSYIFGVAFNLIILMSKFQMINEFPIEDYDGLVNVTTTIHYLGENFARHFTFIFMFIIGTIIGFICKVFKLKSETPDPSLLTPIVQYIWIKIDNFHKENTDIFLENKRFASDSYSREFTNDDDVFKSQEQILPRGASFYGIMTTAGSIESIILPPTSKTFRMSMDENAMMRPKSKLSISRYSSNALYDKDSSGYTEVNRQAISSFTLPQYAHENSDGISDQLSSNLLTNLFSDENFKSRNSVSKPRTIKPSLTLTKEQFKKRMRQESIKTGKELPPLFQLPVSVKNRSRRSSHRVSYKAKDELANFSSEKLTTPERPNEPSAIEDSGKRRSTNAFFFPKKIRKLGDIDKPAPGEKKENDIKSDPLSEIISVTTAEKSSLRPEMPPIPSHVNKSKNKLSSPLAKRTVNNQVLNKAPRAGSGGTNLLHFKSSKSKHSSKAFEDDDFSTKSSKQYSLTASLKDYRPNSYKNDDSSKSKSNKNLSSSSNQQKQRKSSKLDKLDEKFSTSSFNSNKAKINAHNFSMLSRSPTFFSKSMDSITKDSSRNDEIIRRSKSSPDQHRSPLNMVDKVNIYSKFMGVINSIESLFESREESPQLPTNPSQPKLLINRNQLPKNNQFQKR